MTSFTANTINSTAVAHQPKMAVERSRLKKKIISYRGTLRYCRTYNRWLARAVAWAVGRLTSILSPNGLNEGAPKVAESPTAKFHHTAVRVSTTGL